MEAKKEQKQVVRESHDEKAEKAGGSPIFETEEIKVEEMAIDGICGVY